MIKLTDETRVIKDSKFLKDKSQVGKEVDDSLYLERLDKNNSILRRGDNVENSFADVRVALTRSLNYAIKGSSVALSLESIIETINGMDEAISKLECKENEDVSK